MWQFESRVRCRQQLPFRLNRTRATDVYNRSGVFGSYGNGEENTGFGVYGAVMLGRRQERKNRQRYEESQLELAERTATLERMQLAWEISPEDVIFNNLIGEGTYGLVWKGRWGNQAVAIKVLKHTVTAELDSNRTDDFRQECETNNQTPQPSGISWGGDNS